MTVSIDVGHGRNHNLNARGKPQYAAFTDLMPGLARAGALWLEMYQGVRIGAGTAPMTPAEWRALPGRFVGFLEAYGGNVTSVHYMFGNAGAPTRSCADPQACAWSLAALPGINRTVLANGPGRIPARRPGRCVACAVRQLLPVAGERGVARLVATCGRRPQGRRSAAVGGQPYLRYAATQLPAISSCAVSSGIRPLQTRWLSAFSRWSFGLA